MSHFNFQYYSISNIGKTRKRNEDRYHEVPEHAFFALADGMGGHKAGDVAAGEAISTLTVNLSTIDLDKPGTPSPFMNWLKNALQHANTSIYSLAKENAKYKGMGTTLSCFFLSHNHLIYGHVGDSRLYRYRIKLEQITKDHSLREDLIEKGELKKEDAQNYRYRNVLTRAVGTHKEVIVDTGFVTTEPGDIYFLCSDGLSDALTDEEIAKEIEKTQTIEKLTQNLVEKALSSGGHDNITIVMVKILPIS